MKTKLKKLPVLLVVLALVLALIPVAVFADTGDVAWIGNTGYTSLKEAVDAAQSGDTITLGEGNYTLYRSGAATSGKDLTFVGKGTDKTYWNIGAEVPDPNNYGTEYNGDYSFDGAGTVTFKDMTLRSGSADYLGFIRMDKFIVDGCVVNGKIEYCGTTAAEFKNTTFNPPTEDYSIWTGSTLSMTFDSCTFNSTGKVINVYNDGNYKDKEHTINFKDCTVNASSLKKQVLNINDSNLLEGGSYTINLEGNNTVNVTNTDPETCSTLFGFGGKNATNNKGNTVVNVNGETVFKTNGETENKKGVRISHAAADKHEFTYEYKWDEDDGVVKCSAVATCSACGYEEEAEVEATATTSATCTEAGKVIYVADFSKEEVTDPEIKFENQQKEGDAQAALGHDWGEATYEWTKTDDGYTCTATRVCARDASHTETETVAAAVVVTKEATDTEKGEVKYTATFKNEAFAEQTKLEELAVGEKTPAETTSTDKTSAEKKTTAKTDDANNIVLWSALLVSSGVAFAGVIAKKKRSFAD